MNVKHWLLGWLLAFIMVGVGVVREWWGLVAFAGGFSLFWWYAPDIFPYHTDDDPPGDIR